MVRVWLLVRAPGLQTPDLGVLTDIKLMDVLLALKTRPSFQVPSVLQKRKRLKHWTNMPFACMTLLPWPQCCSCLAPGSRPFSVGKPEKRIDVSRFHVSSAHLNERLLTETAKQQGVTLTGTL